MAYVPPNTDPETLEAISQNLSEDLKLIFESAMDWLEKRLNNDCPENDKKVRFF
ncbi:MAG: hypothetical protein ACE5GM_08515 [bacterium]